MVEQMNYRSCTLSDLAVEKQEIYRTLGYDGACEGELDVLVHEVLGDIGRICKARYMYALLPGKVQDSVSVSIQGVVFRTGRKITSYLDEADHFCAFVTTAGKEYDAYKDDLRVRGDFVREYIADAIGSVIAEACVAKISEELTCENIPQTYPYSPGYCGWNLTEQRKLFSLFPDSPCGIQLTDSCLMMPIKSISGIMATGSNIRRQDYGCVLCEIKNCYKRKKS
jgi:hypothetical protein